MSTFLAFLGVSVIVIVTPGPDTAITIRNTLFGGRGGGVFTALGIASGQTIWAFATSLGIVALLVASAPLFRQICRGRLPGLPRHPGVAGGRAADRPGAFDPPGREAAPVAMGGLSAGSAEPRSRGSCCWGSSLQ